MRAPGVMQKVLALAIVCLLASSVGAGAQEPQGDEDVAVVDIGVLRDASGASAIPVRVTVISRRALDGTIQLTARDTNVSWELPVGLAANSEVEQLFVVPTDGLPSLRLSASLVVDGEEVADDDSDVANAPTNVVGLLGLTTAADEVQLSPDVGKASIIVIDDLTALAAFDTVVTSPAGMRSLTDGERARLLRWTAAGRQLAVADEPGSITGLLPANWRDDSQLVAAGTGFIRYIGAEWETNVPAGVSTATNPQAAAGWFQASSPELLSDAGFRVPGLGAMAILLLAYLILAGPVTFVVLSQTKRQTLAWIVVPALAAVFAVGVFGVGRVLSSGRGNGYATVVEVSPAGASITDTVLIADDGRQTVELPEGWSLQSTGLTAGNGPVGSPVVVAPTRGSTDLRFDIDSGSGGTAVLLGSSGELDGAISIVEATLDGSSLRGFVGNSSGERLDNVTVLVGQRLTSVGSIDDGARGEFIVDLSVERNEFAPEVRTWDVDPRDGWQFGRARRDDDEAINDGPANGSAWLEWRAARLGTSVPEGMITAVGWTRDLDVSIVDGTGRTALVTHASIPRLDGPALPAHVRSLQLQVPGQDQFGNFDGFGGESGLVGQFIRPSGADTSELSIALENQIAEVEVWTTEGTWRSLRLDEAGGLSSVAIPAEAWLDDVLTVRYSLSEFFGELRQVSTRLTVRTDQTQPGELMPIGERSRRNTNFDDGAFFEPEAVVGLQTDITLSDDGTFEADGELFGTYDIWRLTLNEGDEVRVRMDDTGGFVDSQLDPFLVVRGPDGRQVAENDDFDGLNSGLDFVADVEGTYEIETRPLGGSRSGGSYVVRVEATLSEGSGQ